MVDRLSRSNALQSKLAGGQDAFVARLSADGNTLLFSTYLGGPEAQPYIPKAARRLPLMAKGTRTLPGRPVLPIFRLLHPAQSSLRGLSTPS